MSDANLIQSLPPQAVMTQIERFNVPYRGKLESSGINKFAEQVISDVRTLADQGNVNAQAIVNAFHVIKHETDIARQFALEARAHLSMQRRIAALMGHRLPHWIDLHDGSDISFVEDAPASLRAAVSTQFGQATVPMNAIESKLYSTRILAEGTVVPNTLIVSTTGIFDKQDGNGLTNYEYDGTIEETDPRNMCNGNNQDYWRRRAIFPLDSDISEVECEATITVPESANLYANMVAAHPYPLGNIDITGIWISPDLSGSFTALPSFAEKRGATQSRWFLPDQKVAQIKVRIRQRNWHEENGRKIFEYGFQELGLFLVEWDQTYDSNAATLADNHAFVARIEAEPGFKFYQMYGFYSMPDWTLEPSDNRHLHFVVAKDADGAIPVWDSDQNVAPQSGSPINLGGVSELYIITTLNWVATAGVGSPFEVYTTPWVEGMGIDCSYVRSTS